MNQFFKIIHQLVFCLLLAILFIACNDSTLPIAQSKKQGEVSKNDVNCLLNNETNKAKTEINAVFVQVSWSKEKTNEGYKKWVSQLLPHSQTPYPHSNLMIGLFLEQLNQKDKATIYYQKEITFYQQIFVDSSLHVCDEVAYPFIETAASAYLFLNDEKGYNTLKKHLSNSTNLNIQNHIDLIPKNKTIAKNIYGL
ncbi:MAG: hypothetical protein IT221_09430 [Fluviicola sp.]|nr:hypothetical protein [Fluviicola sp.]